MFTYPFDSAEILKKHRSLKKQLLADGSKRIKKNIAVLGGSTTSNIVDVLELFLLDYGIEPTFYQSEYAQFWQDAMFGNPELDAFNPDVIYIHTSNRNITAFPEMGMSNEEINKLFENQCSYFHTMWEKLAEKNCPIIQNNFEMPFYRLLGNKDVSDIHGRTNFINRLNAYFYSYAQSHSNFYINDIDYISASYGLKEWSNPLYWNMYKYCLCVPAIPEFAFNLSHIIKSIFGKNKKALALDLDNTLWGGVVGDDGVDGIQVGPEVPMGQVYSEFQSYLKAHKSLGVLLTVCSKNDHENAVAGLNHPDGVLKPDDFIIVKANWENKDRNIAETAAELNILPESIVFVDDNPAERAIVKAQLGIEAPDMDDVENYIQTLDRNGYFEVTSFSDDDLKRNEMYKENAKRAEQLAQFSDYGEYLDSLNMIGTIEDFTPIYLQRITQLTNKSNQFNVTTKRYTAAEMEAVYNDSSYIRLYGKLEDKFGDNGVVSVVIGKISGDMLDIELWLMSCRVLKRDMELAMLDSLVEEAEKHSICKIVGNYYPTAKNSMVKDLFDRFRFTKISEDEHGNKKYELAVKGYTKQNHHINVQKGQ